MPISPLIIPIAEVFADLATEVTDEIIYLENVQDLNPDVRELSNISPRERGAENIFLSNNQVNE
ncbi:MAG TPA: hypothetical protein VKY40_08855 [Halanaerobiales bacterium]|nr:hypothetical protein [Halanaerobiales bacterium]